MSILSLNKICKVMICSANYFGLRSITICWNVTKENLRVNPFLQVCPSGEVMCNSHLHSSQCLILGAANQLPNKNMETYLNYESLALV